MSWCYIACGLAALCALFYAIISFKRKTHLAAVTGTMFLAACAVNLTYLGRIGAGTYFAASLTTSAYFVCLDFLVLSMVYYMIEFTQSRIEAPRFKKTVIFTVYLLTGVDAAILILNVFREVVLRYQYQKDSVYAIKYMFEAKWGFYMHPAVLVYGFVCPLVYRNTFDYTSKGMLNTTRKMVLEYMGRPVILFDYEGYVADTNRDMRELFPILKSQEQRISMMDFLQLGAFRDLQSIGEDQTFEWENPGSAGARRYQCAFTCLRDERGRSIGHLLIMTNLETERDMLTRLYSKDSFYSETDKVLSQGIYPVTVVVCNANGIGLVNDVFGWRRGNELLRQAADLLRENLPANAILARMEDGDMAAALTEAEQEYAVRLFEKIKEQYREANDTGINTDMEYGIAVIRDETKSVEEAVREAAESMRTKKMMNQSSQKSSLLDSLTQTLTESDYETEEHVERTREMAIRLGQALHLADGELGKLALLAVLHDIGKIAIPHSILLKPGKLTEAEWEIMKTHTEKGYRIANASKELKPIGEYILHHHERWDGGGYPGGLAGEEIPLLSRIITVVDSHDVMVHDRPYHKAMNEEDAKRELLRCSGTQFDPKLVEVFLSVIGETKVS